MPLSANVSGEIMPTIQISAGQTKKILSKFSNSIPTTYQFSATTTGGDAPTGAVAVKGSSWVFPKPAETQPLQAKNTVTKSMWNVFFSVSVTPDQDVTIGFQTSHWQVRDLLKWVAIFFGGMILLSIIMNLLGVTPPPK